jgi:hypothetical protein
MIKPESGIALPAMPQVVPESVDALVAETFSDRVRPALPDEAGVSGTAFGLHQRIVVPGGGRVDVDAGRSHVKIASENCLHAGSQ